MNRTANTHALEKSDCAVVPVNQPNKEGQPYAEVGEGRAQTEENIVQSHMCPTQSGKRMSQGLHGVRQAARGRKQERLTALLHHLRVGLLRDSFYGGIEDQPGPGTATVRAIAEAAQHLLRPGSAPCGRQLECRPQAVSAARERGAVEIAGATEDQPGLGGGSARAIEVIQHLFRPASAPCWHQLEHVPLSGVLPKEVVPWRLPAASKTSPAADWSPSVPPKLYSTFSVQVPAAPGVNSNTIPPGVSAAGLGGAVEIAGGIEDQPGSGTGPVRSIAEAI